MDTTLVGEEIGAFGFVADSLVHGRLVARFNQFERI
jgi:hypothetical protein